MNDKFECRTCGKNYNKKYNLDRHVEKMHPEEDSDKDSDEEDFMTKEDEVEVIGLLVKDIINDMEEDNEEEEDGKMESVADILKPENYSQLQEEFKDKVLELILL